MHSCRNLSLFHLRTLSHRHAVILRSHHLTRVIAHLNQILMNGCLKASAGVILFSGFNSKHRPNKSMKLDSNPASPSETVPLPSSLCFSSLVGFCIFKGFITSFFVTGSTSFEIKINCSLKWAGTSCPFLSIFAGNLPRHSIMWRSIWLFDRPGKRILPVYNSKRVQPIDQMSIA